MNSDTLSRTGPDGVHEFGSGLAIAMLTSLAIGALYLFSLSAGLGWHDSAELSARAALLGGTHSPGSPLHTLTGWIFVQFFAEPATATNVLSAVSMGAAAGFLAMLTWQICGRLMLLAALLFACSYQVWTNAVVTELYGLSAFLGLLACVLLRQWHTGRNAGWLFGGLVACGLSMAAWLPMALLAPAVIWLLWSDRETFGRNLLWSAGIGTAALLVIIALNAWLALRLPPHGPDLPLSATGIFRYLTGAMHEPLAVRDAGFFVGRVVEHTVIFARSFLWVGLPLGILGAVAHIARDRVFGIFLLALFGIQMSYFTLFGAGDYYSMVILSYAVFSLWIVVGTLWLAERAGKFRALSIAVLACLPALQVWQQLPQRLAAGIASPAQKFVDTSFASLPADALLIAGWQQFTALEYGQVIQNQRPDLQLILPATTPRHYGSEIVPNYLELVAASYCSRPVFTHKVKPELEARYGLQPVVEAEGWYRLIDEQAGCD